MSKESRRAARLARESRQAGIVRPAAGSDAPPEGDGEPLGPTPGQSGSATPAAAASPAARARAGRRPTARLAPRRTFLERNRSAIVTIAAVAVVAVALGFVFIGSASTAYACTNIFSPSPTPPLAPGSSDRLGFFQEDMANSHVVNPPQTYLYCPPASGNHYNGSGIGPIQPRVYKPEDKVGPANWIHNLEHGGLVVLYRNDSPGATAAGLQAFRDFSAALPPSPICKVATGQVSPVVARFDEMPHAYAALVWDRVFYLDTWDPALVNQFYLTEVERLDSDGALVSPPEKVYCTGSPAPSVDPAASVSPAASAPASVAPSVAPSAPPSASPEPSAAPS